MSNKLTTLDKAVLATIVFYDVLDFPLDLINLEKCLISPKRINSRFKGDINIEKIILSLAVLQEENFIEEKNGFYFLRARQGLYDLYIYKRKLADLKWKKARKAIRWLALVPYLRIIFGSGSLAMNNTDEKSDLDVLVITKAGRIWTARFLITALLSLLKVRRTRYDTVAPDKICLNHYITDKSLKIPFESLYNAQTYRHLVPVLEIRNKLFGILDLTEEFFEANEWAKKYLFNWPLSKLDLDSFKRVGPNSFLVRLSGWLEKILDTQLGDIVEKILKNIQLKRIKPGIEARKPGSRITADDTQLEFHPDSPEFGIIMAYNQKLKDLGFSELAKETDSGLL